MQPEISHYENRHKYGQARIPSVAHVASSNESIYLCPELIHLHPGTLIDIISFLEIPPSSLSQTPLRHFSVEVPLC